MRDKKGIDYGEEWEQLWDIRMQGNQSTHLSNKYSENSK